MRLRTGDETARENWKRDGDSQADVVCGGGVWWSRCGVVENHSILGLKKKRSFDVSLMHMSESRQERTTFPGWTTFLST